jgi:hypothetical protein
MDGMTCFLNSIYIWGKGDRVRFNFQGEDKVEACLDIFNGEMGQECSTSMLRFQGWKDRIK